jgi:chitin synthase
MLYTTGAGMYIIVKELRDPTTKIALGNNIFTNLVVSSASTIGLYFFMSFMYLDPWHMLTSSVQYFALLPSYICTLQVYAFCNTHDVTWGTKGDNVSRTDLGTASGKDGVVELEMPSEQLDIDSCYDGALRNLRDRVEVPEPPLGEAQAQEDYYRAVRTYMVIVWLVSNAVLAMAVSEAYGASHVADNFYLKFILWSVAAVALFRAVGSGTFAIMSVVRTVAEGRVRWSTKWSERGSRVGSSRGSTGGSWSMKPSSWVSGTGGWFRGIGGKVKGLGS